MTTVVAENELDEQPEKIKLIFTKGLRKDLMKTCRILNGVKHFPSDVLKNYLVFISAKKYIEFLVALLKFIHGNLMEYQKKYLKCSWIKPKCCSKFD